MSIRVFIPKDAAALSVGAERVAKAVMAEAVIRNIPLELVRTGTRGACWLEPLAEIEIDGVRHGYGPVTPADVPGLFDAGFLTAGAHRLALGPVEELDWFKRQERLTFARCGIIDPLSLDDYAAQGGLVGPADRAWPGTAGHRGRPSSSPACGDAAARAFRPASSGTRC